MEDLIRAGYKDVIHVDKNGLQTLADCVHKPLKGLSSILKPEGHSQKLIQTERRNDSGLWYVLGCYRNLMISLNKIDLVKHLSIF